MKHETDNVPRVNHVHAMFQGDLNDVVLGKVCRDWSETFPHLISLISLWVHIREFKIELADRE